MRIEPVIQHQPVDGLLISEDMISHHELRLIFAPDPLAVRTALKSAIGGLQKLNMPPDACGSAELVLAEVMNNIVEHAFADGRDGVIELRIDQHDTGVHCEVLDDGAPMPGGEHPIGQPANLEVDLEDLPEGGFGWFLIGQLTEDLCYERRNDRNRLRFKLNSGTPVLNS